MRDLTDADADAIARTRTRVAHEGLGARILGLQDGDGAWRRPDRPIWATTLFTLLLLRSTGVDRTDAVVESAISRLEKLLGWSDRDGSWELRSIERGATTFFEGEVEPCINGGVLALGAYFGRPSERLARRLVGEQLDDGGWNCEAPKSSRSSFHTTICVLEGLLEYERATGSHAEIASARKRGEDYLLERGLFRRRSTGGIVNHAFLEFAFPPRYRYDVLRALDYFRSTGSALDARAGDAVYIVRSKRQADGRWLLDRAYDETLTFAFPELVGAPSAWNTLRALRVLRSTQRDRLGERAFDPRVW